MQLWQEFLANQVLMCAVISWFAAQLLKTLIDLWYNKELSIERMWGSGGMPSSHSSTVSALLISSAYVYRVNSFEFAVSFVLASIVMHDAMGVRRETGKQAKLLNLIMESDFSKVHGIEDFQESLKEFVGHTPLQVLMGSILGILIAVIMHTFFYQ